MERIRVLITDELAKEGIETLKAQPRFEICVTPSVGEENLANMVGDFHALLVRSKTQVTRRIVDSATQLKLIGRAGSGLDNIDSDAALAKGIEVINAPQGNAISTAEYTVGLLFALARFVPQAHESLRQGKWEKSAFLGTELRGKTLGLLGIGHIGSEVARLASGIKMHVIAHDPFVKEHASIELVGRDALLSSSDFLSVHIPLNAQTKHTIAARELALMKKGSYVLNAARGGIIDEQALLGALNAGHITGAACDVFEEEPPSKTHLFLKHPRIIVTPHLGASTKEAQVKVAQIIAQKTIEFFKA
jgi:D-3-phosphoglycerate dehydrogenase